MTPTYTVGSFIIAPAERVTNIQSAEFVKEDTTIYAIRVKIAGISEYFPAAAKTIERVAMSLRQSG